jgi:hypothetical protein
MGSRPADFDFDRSTQVVRRGMSAGPGLRDPGVTSFDVTSFDVTSFDVIVHDGWDIMGNANGGYVMAIIARALTEVTGRPDCITVTCHYLAPCPAGPAVVDVVPVRAGRRFATATATMWREVDGVRKVIAQVMATMGDLEKDPGGPTSMAGGPSPIPSYEECLSFGGPNDAASPALHTRLATRFHPDDVGFRDGHRSGRGLIRGWFAFRDDRPIDALALLLASDAFPPAVFNLDVATNWVPTVELTVHVRAIPAPGPVQCSFETRYLQNGLLDEDGEIWDSGGVLVAQSRQLALAPRAG